MISRERSHRRPSRLGAITLVAAVLGLGLSSGLVLAGSGITTSFWSGSNFTLSTSQHNVSNAAAWWQNILNSTGKCVAVNGVFGISTKNASIAWQNDSTFGFTPPFFPGSANGVVNQDDYNAMQFAKDPFGIYRHRYAGYTDGYATQYWLYYGGGEAALMGWNPYAHQQFFNPYRISQASQSTGWTLIAASANRTIGSYSCAA